MIVDIFSPDVTERLGNRLWVLISPFKFSIDEQIYTVPRGFITDGASCPRILWNICSPVAGPFGQAAIAHDFFYSPEGPDIGRFNADRVLYTLGRFRGAGMFRAQLVKSGVNFFGWQFYKQVSEKMTEESCYHLADARQRVLELTI